MSGDKTAAAAKRAIEALAELQRFDALNQGVTFRTKDADRRRLVATVIEAKRDFDLAEFDEGSQARGAAMRDVAGSPGSQGRWGPARSAKRRQHDERVIRAHSLRADDGLTPAQIAARMTAERAQLQRPAIHARTVQRWLAEPKPTAD